MIPPILILRIQELPGNRPLDPPQRASAPGFPTRFGDALEGLPTLPQQIPPLDPAPGEEEDAYYSEDNETQPQVSQSLTRRDPTLAS